MRSQFGSHEQLYGRAVCGLSGLREGVALENHGKPFKTNRKPLFFLVVRCLLLIGISGASRDYKICFCPVPFFKFLGHFK